MVPVVTSCLQAVSLAFTVRPFATRPHLSQKVPRGVKATDEVCNVETQIVPNFFPVWSVPARSLSWSRA